MKISELAMKVFMFSVITWFVFNYINEWNNKKISKNIVPSPTISNQLKAEYENGKQEVVNDRNLRK